MHPIRTLILSGGGGRGAFHAGVYRYLSEHDWQPDIVVGTSIGAVNGAAIAQGISADSLCAIWRSLREKDIQGIPPGMRPLARWVANRVWKGALGVPLPQVPASEATSQTPAVSWPPLPLLPGWLGEKLVGRWMNLLDTGPLKRTLRERFRLDEARIAGSPTTLLIAATDVQTGQRVLFSNRDVVNRWTGESRPDVVAGITLTRILASCSIPLVYPWTKDEQTGRVYWDGAVVANTPLGAALDVVRDVPPDVPMEVVVVLMTPWWENHGSQNPYARGLPQSFDEAITWTLDWALLASFRERLRQIRFFNQLAEQEMASGVQERRHRLVHVRIAAPQEFFPASRILDYDAYSATLIRLGEEAAARAMENGR
ncbi:MAG: hypothetical protein D6755_04340 [Anaerolineae bacterium]|nr:MAG: hypothetical protein D6755_04340 [Anaerolineae bacterium]